jgi:hypothetical protein
MGLGAMAPGGFAGVAEDCSDMAKPFEAAGSTGYWRGR